MHLRSAGMSASVDVRGDGRSPTLTASRTSVYVYGINSYFRYSERPITDLDVYAQVRSK